MKYDTKHTSDYFQGTNWWDDCPFASSSSEENFILLPKRTKSNWVSFSLPLVNKSMLLIMLVKIFSFIFILDTCEYNGYKDRGALLGTWRCTQIPLENTLAHV